MHGWWYNSPAHVVSPRRDALLELAAPRVEQLRQLPKAPGCLHRLLVALRSSQAEETAGLLEVACAAVTCAGTRLRQEKAPLNNQPY